MIENLSEICKQAEVVIKTTGKYIAEQSLKFQTTQIEYKGKNDLVSYVDKTAEQMLVENLNKILPEAGFLTEENTIAAEENSLRWIIDPLDGTTNFIHGLPVYAVSVGLEYDKEIILGIVYEVNKDECFSAYKNGGAYLNGKRFYCSPIDSLERSLVATGFPYFKFEQLPQYLEILQELMQKTHGLRRMGSAAVDLAYAACGRFEAFFEYNLNPWDVAGGVILIEEAGGKCVDFNGGNDFVHGRSIIAGNKKVVDEMQEIIHRIFV